MVLCKDLCDKKLPDIAMYAGDTTPWSVVLIRQNGNPYPYASVSGANCTLTLMPYSVTVGMDSRVISIPPVLIKTGSITNDPSGTGTGVFTFDYEDTIGLRGKYIYQIEIENEGDHRVSQGYLTVKQNNNPLVGD